MRHHTFSRFELVFNNENSIPTLTFEFECSASLYKKSTLFIEDFGCIPKHASEKQPLSIFPAHLKLDHPSDLSEWISPLLISGENSNGLPRIICSISSNNNTFILEAEEKGAKVEVSNLPIVSSLSTFSLSYILPIITCKVT